MKLADEICLKLYGSTSTKPEQELADAVLRRAIQACHTVAAEHGHDRNCHEADATAIEELMSGGGE